jgi:hypothetical protein
MPHNARRPSAITRVMPVPSLVDRSVLGALRAARRHVVILAGALTWACAEGNDGPSLHAAPPTLVGTRAVVMPAEVEAGAPAEVRCVGLWSDGSEAALDEAVVVVAPSSGVAVEPRRVVATVAGSYALTCVRDTLPAAPAAWVVRPGPAARVVATVVRGVLPVGESSAVTCRVEDVQGNLREDPTTVGSSSVNGAPVTDHEVRGAIPGEYTVYCEAGRLSSTAVPLVVVPGAPVVLRASLDRYEVRAGEHVTVYCQAEDVGGNRVDVRAEVRVDVTPDSTDATGLVPARATPHLIRCALPAQSLESAPVELTVRPGLPAELTVTEVLPAQPIYGKGETIELGVRMRDVFGNDVPAANVEITSRPTTAVQPAGVRRVILLGNGSIPLTARVTSPTHEGRVVEGTVTITLDGAPPVIVITSPARGAIVSATPGQVLTVRGEVTDATTSVTSLSVNGRPVTVARDGSFSTTMVPSWGLNVIEATAVDDVGNTRALAQSFELASRYRRASPSRIAAARIDDGLVLRLGRTALDDNNADVDDLATIARLAVEQVDLATLIPSPVTTYNSDCSIPFVTIRGALRLYVDDVRYASPTFDFTPIAGGLRLRVEVNNAVVDLHTSGDVCDVGVGLSGSARATRIVVTADLMVSANNGQVTARVSSRNVQISGLSIDLRLPSIIDWAVDGIINLFSGAISGQLESAFGDVIASEVPPVIEQFLEAVAVGTLVRLPAPLSLTLGVDSRLGSLAFDAQGGSTGLDTTLYAAGTIVPEPPGGILQEARTAPAFDPARALGVGISFDLVNQALYALWYGGGLDLDLDPSSFSSQGGSRAHLRAGLPPVLRPSGVASHPLELQAGELAIDLDLSTLPGLPPVRATLIAAFRARASVTVDAQGQLQLALAPTAEVSVDFDVLLDGLTDVVAFTQALESTLASLLPQLVGQVLRGIPIPTIDLSSMAGTYLPAGIVLGVGQASVAVQPSYLVMQGNVVRVP